jgi:hypothetical protein
VDPEEPRTPWDRRAGESAKAHAYFRRFRDLGPLRSFDVLVDPEHAVTGATLRKWSQTFDWRDRAQAWDEEAHRAEDASRLEALRGMHDRHQRAGRLAMQKALAALQGCSPDDIPPYAAARLLELGARLERDTLTVSVEELQGRTPAPPEDPWEQVARELDQQPLP